VKLIAALKNGPRLIRYYQAALINTAFGYGLYAALVALGLNMFVAQIVSQVCGMTFNYFTYSRHAFRDDKGSKLGFVLAYGANYLVNLVLLAVFALFMPSPYLAGLAATLTASLINYFVLRNFVFRPPGNEAAAKG
jgi:putative flippase GtrA